MVRLSRESWRADEETKPQHRPHDSERAGRERIEIRLVQGQVTFAEPPASGRFRLLIEEREHIPQDVEVWAGRGVPRPARLIYAETFELDDALLPPE